MTARRGTQIGVRVNPDEHDLLELVAGESHLPVASWVRMTALRAARRALDPRPSSEENATLDSVS